MYTVHCTLYTVHCTLHTALRSLQHIIGFEKRLKRTMEAMTDDQLVEELARRKDFLLGKRRAIKIAMTAEKRMGILEELDAVNSKIEETYSATFSRSEESTVNYSTSVSSLASSSSSSSSSTSNSFDPIHSVDQPVVESVRPKQKKSMLVYWAAKETVDVEVMDARRIEDARKNSESRQAESHRSRILAVGKKKSAPEYRPCSATHFAALRRNLKGNDLISIEYLTAEKKLWCSACPCFVGDDNLLDHVVTVKHLSASKAAMESNLRQSSLVSAISISKTLSENILPKTHLFRCELVRTLLTSALPVYKADDLREIFEKWTKIELTDSSNLMRAYLPIIKVCKFYEFNAIL